MDYWSFEIEITDDSDSDELGGMCHALGAEGVVEIEDQRLRVYLSGPQQQAEAQKQLILKSIGIEDHPLESLRAENWVQKHAPIFEPVRCQHWILLPFESPPQPYPQFASNEIGTIPGMGFGTGHHSSTRLALDLLATPNCADLPAQPIRALDIGTGNGILAIAVEKRFSCSEIAASDIDSQALINARETAELNGCKKISFFQGSLPPLENHYDLITANLYAEVLVDLAPSLNQLSTTGTNLVVSGIMSPKAPMVKKALESSWKRIVEVEEDQWTAMLLRRI